MVRWVGTCIVDALSGRLWELYCCFGAGTCSRPSPEPCICPVRHPPWQAGELAQRKEALDTALGELKASQLELSLRSREQQHSEDMRNGTLTQQQAQLVRGPHRAQGGMLV